MSDNPQAVPQGRTPEGIYWSLVAGVSAWFANLGINYTLEQHSCSTGHHYVLYVTTAICFVIALSGALIGFAEIRKHPIEVSEEGGDPEDRAHFQSLLGVALSASFAVSILAVSVPMWILNPCE
jgi:hypothetical protein